MPYRALTRTRVVLAQQQCLLGHNNTLMQVPSAAWNPKEPLPNQGHCPANCHAHQACPVARVSPFGVCPAPSPKPPRSQTSSGSTEAEHPGLDAGTT